MAVPAAVVAEQDAPHAMNSAPTTYRDAANRHRIDLAVSVLLGLLAAVAAAQLGNRSNVVLGLGLMCIAVLPLIAWLRNADVVAGLAVALVAFTIPINLDINPLYRPHTGGAPSITINLTVIALGLLLLVWLYRTRTGLQQHLLTLHKPLLWSVLVLLAVVPLSAINADDLSLVALEWIRLICLVVAMLAVMSLQNDWLARVWIFVLSLQVMIQTALAGAQYATKQTLGLGIFGEGALVEQRLSGSTVVNRATGTIGHPNILAYFFEILVPVMLALALTRQPAHRRIWYALVCVAGLVGMITTLSRGSWLTLPVSITIVLVSIVGHRIVRVRSMVAAGLLGCALIAPIYYAYPTIERRFTHTDYKSSGSRAPLNRAAWSIVEQHPVIGIGLNNMAEVFKREDTTSFARTFHGVQHVVHNQFLWMWVETGTLGLLAFLTPFVVAMVTALRTASRAPPVPKAILVGLACGLLAHLMHGMLDPGFRISLSVSFLVFTSFGLIGHYALRYPARRRAPVVTEAPHRPRADHVHS